ncbi:MAG: HAMP domain-containing protein [Leptospiraceae bacterium]|nr:HAMP domain-containing protein [Leptospiraceae bacterium]MCP5512839.1 HAMP domain-containing protein [Leptospiraceae bacterium]
MWMFRIVFTFILIPILGNILTAFWAFLIAPLVFSPETNVLYQSIMEKYYYSPISLIFIALFLIFSYLLKPLILLEMRKEKAGEREAVRIMNLPILFAGFVFCGWILSGTLADILVYKIEGIEFKIFKYPLLLGFSFNLFSATFSFILFFYLLEFMNRIWFIPNYIGTNILSEFKGIYRLSVKNHFLIFTFSASIYPIAILMSAILNFNRYIDRINLDRLLTASFYASGFLILMSLLIMIFLSNLYQSPLIEMKKLARSIQEGDYETRFRVVSTDEIGILGETLNSLSAKLKEGEFIKESFGKMVSPEVRDYLLEENTNLGGETREITILFSDLRGFTTISEFMPPDKIVELLNMYFERMTICISKNHGLVNKYIGDAILAVFGTPLPHPDHPENAILAALDMRRELVNLNSEFRKIGFPELKMGMGIHTGTVLAGNVGSSHRMEFTVIGDAVNLASRLEGLCKEFNKDLILSEDTFQFIQSRFKTEFISQKIVKGRSIPIGIYTIN